MIDTEDAAVQANKMAPGRFVWRKYPEQINIENVRTFLSDAKKPKNGGYLVGSGKDGWHLTEAGNAFANSLASLLPEIKLARKRATVKERKWQKQERARLVSHPAIRKALERGTEGLSSSEVDSVFRVNEYITGATRNQKIERLLSAFQSDEALGEVLRQLGTIAIGA